MKKKDDNNEWVDSASVKLTLETDVLPSAVTIGHSFYKVRAFVEEPRRCFNCQRVGHFARSCKSSTKCSLCSENHEEKNCRKNPDEYKFANCNARHVANTKECRYYNTARQIEAVRAHDDIATILSLIHI